MPMYAELKKTMILIVHLIIIIVVKKIFIKSSLRDHLVFGWLVKGSWSQWTEEEGMTLVSVDLEIKVIIVVKFIVIKHAVWR